MLSKTSNILLLMIVTCSLSSYAVHNEWLKEDKYAVQLKGVFFDAATQSPVAGVEVLITNTNNSKTILLYTNKEGVYKCPLNDKATYVIKGKKNLYFETDNHQISTKSLKEEKVLTYDIPILKIEKSQKYILKELTFPINTPEITGEIDLWVERISKLKSAHPDAVIEISFHTDARGNDQYNLELSQKRAAFFQKTLLENNISLEGISIVGHGEKFIKNDCGNGVKCINKEHLENRRVELKIITF